MQAKNVDAIILAKSKAFTELALSILGIFLCMYVLGQEEIGIYLRKLIVNDEALNGGVLMKTGVVIYVFLVF